MFNEQRYTIVMGTIQAFKSDTTRLTDITILLTEEEAKRLNDEESKLLEGLNFGLEDISSTSNSALRQYFVSKQRH